MTQELTSVLFIWKSCCVLCLHVSDHLHLHVKSRKVCNKTVNSDLTARPRSHLVVQALRTQFLRTVQRNFVCDVGVRPLAPPSVRTDSGGGGRGIPRQRNGGGECHLFLAGNRAVLLGNRRFSWREIA